IHTALRLLHQVAHLHGYRRSGYNDGVARRENRLPALAELDCHLVGVARLIETVNGVSVTTLHREDAARTAHRARSIVAVTPVDRHRVVRCLCRWVPDPKLAHRQA